MKKCRFNETELIEKYKGLVISIAKSFRPPQSELDDYIQCGNIGLLRAIRSHIPSKGKLITIAVPSIKWEILYYIKKNKRKEYTNKDYDIVDIDNNIYINDYICDILNSKELEVIHMKNAGMTLKEISNKTHCSLSWISQLYNKAIIKIRNANS